MKLVAMLEENCFNFMIQHLHQMNMICSIMNMQGLEYGVISFATFGPLAFQASDHMIFLSHYM
jgi:hypothetical protein